MGTKGFQFIPSVPYSGRKEKKGEERRKEKGERRTEKGERRK